MGRARLEMWFLLLLASASAASTCGLNDDSSACNATSAFSCVNVCWEYQTQGPCNSFAACNWTQESCRPLNTTFDCSVYTDAASCSQQPACFPKTSPCRYVQRCYKNNVEPTCNNATTATQCASPNFASLGCNWTAQCLQTTLCNALTLPTQGACTAVPGCHWQEYSITEKSVTQEVKDCVSCFTDPSNTVSLYLNAAAKLGKTCNFTKDYDPTYFGVAVVKVVAAGSNCTGGVPYVKPGYIESCNTQAAAAAGLTTSLATLCLAALLA